MMQKLQQAAHDLGLPLGERTKTYNSRLAQELAKWAEFLGKGELFHEAVFRAYFVEGINIGKADQLAKLAGLLGLPENQALDVLATRSFQEAVDADWLRSRTLGITAVPTFLVSGKKLVGAQPYDVLEQFLLKAGARKLGTSGTAH
jgi:predicted DsbA family dithiol-disulfide isomerase